MKISLNTLKYYVDIDVPVDDLCDRMVTAGFEVKYREKQGDKIKLSNGTKKIKDLFIDLKIPKEERSKIPILKDDNGILLVGDYRVSEDYKIDLNTKEVLKVTFSKALE